MDRSRTTTKLHLVVILIILSTALSERIPCFSGDWAVSLDDATHFSDVVLEGRVTRSRKGEFGTYNANVSYSRALKHDGQLARVSLDKVEIVNVHFDATQPEYNMNAIFFLIRQQNADLALHCMTPDEALWSTYQQQYKHKSDLLNHIEQVGEEDERRNSQTDNPYPNPCDHFNTSGCSVQGSECSIVNTLPNERTRCTCVTGYHGDGRNCTALTTEAASAYCEECGRLARCERVSSDGSAVTRPSKEPSTLTEDTVNCTCNHFSCRVTNRQVCGSDGNTYPSVCHMRRTSCESQQHIHLLHSGKCDTTTRPCGGRDLPLFGSTGLITCRRSPCPQMYYCDEWTASSSVCCPVRVEEGSGYSSGSGSGDGSDYSDTENSRYSDTESTNPTDYRI